MWSYILSYFPSRKGKDARKELQYILDVKGGIDFEIRQVIDETGRYLVAESVNLPTKHIITSGKDLVELEGNLKDAIFTAFQVPRFYCDEALLSAPISDRFRLKYATR